MNTNKYFKILTEDIHSVVIATVDNKGLPSTRVIDIMLYDNNGIYFLTAKGKVFYQQLMAKGYVSLSGLTAGKDSMSKKAISISGSVRNISSEKLSEIFETNLYMQSIYPTEESRTALDVFCIYKGQGEFFDLSTQPITRGSFVFGGTKEQKYGYFITYDCKSCGKCLEKCPQQSITVGKPYEINQDHCLRCGNCLDVCPEHAIIRLK